MALHNGQFTLAVQFEDTTNQGDVDTDRTDKMKLYSAGVRSKKHIEAPKGHNETCEASVFFEVVSPGTRVLNQLFSHSRWVHMSPIFCIQSDPRQEDVQ